MESNPNTVTPDETLEKINEEPHTPAKGAHNKRRAMVVAGIVLTALAWCTLMLNEWLSLGLGIAGLVTSAIGVRIPPGPRRDLAITAIIAAAVLVLVIAGIEVALLIFT